MAEREAERITMYGRPGCEDTDMAREWLSGRGIAFHEVDIDTDAEADRYVRRVNDGNRSTPTIVFGEERFIVVEPTPDELDEAIERAGKNAGG